MRRSYVWMSVPVVAVVAAAMALPSSGSVHGDATAAYGPFGFTTKGMGNGASYGEPSMIWAPDGKHGVICTPGSDAKLKGTVQYWYTVDGGKTFKHSVSTGKTHGGGD